LQLQLSGAISTVVSSQRLHVLTTRCNGRRKNCSYSRNGLGTIARWYMTGQLRNCILHLETFDWNIRWVGRRVSEVSVSVDQARVTRWGGHSDRWSRLGLSVALVWRTGHQLWYHECYNVGD